MPVALLFNRKIQSTDDTEAFHQIMIDHKYTQRSVCQELYIMSREFGEDDAIQGDNGIGIIAADVEVNSESYADILPTKIHPLNAVLTLVHEAQLPPLDGKRGNVLTMEWGTARQIVLNDLLACAILHGERGETKSRSKKKHAGAAQDLLRRELTALSSAVSTDANMNNSSSSSSTQEPRDFFVPPPRQTVANFFTKL